MKRKCLAIGIILLFVGTCIIPSIKSGLIHQNNIITVDDEPGDANYISIKEAVNHSNPGDTIEVYSGTYYENGIWITKEGISLIGMPFELGNGSDTGKPFINGQGRDDVVDVKAPNVTITGFHIENRGEGYWCIIIILRNSDGCVISNNTLCYTQNSIIGSASNNTKIINNTIRYADVRYGICLSPYDNNLVSDNVIDHCPTGICFIGGVHNTILRNHISNCSEFGIDIAGSGMNIIQFNTIENNNYGLHIYVASFNRIKQNNFINNTRQAGFDQSLGFTSDNHWAQNYWNRPRILPYPIVGTVFVIMPWVQLDWRPAQEPYDIGV
jgi:parallel beta-helix repeat protein